MISYGDRCRWHKALDIAASRGASVQLCVIHRGAVVLEEAVRCRTDALAWLFSASKPFTSLLVHRLARTGRLHLDDPVARYWPDFGSLGAGSKSETTIREVLTHRTGISSAGAYPAAVLTMHQPERTTQRISGARRRTRRWTRPWTRRRPRATESVPSAYQPLDFGFILAHVVQGATGTEWARLLRELVLEPAGLDDVYTGVPDDQLHRCLPVDISRATFPGGWVVGSVVNRRAVRQAQIPAAGISTTAGGLARFYDHLLSVPELPALCTPSSEGGRDAWTFQLTRWGTGVQLGGTTADWWFGANLFGASSTPSTFGHNGSDVCIGWADPDLQLAVGLVTDRAGAKPADRRLLPQVADTLRAAARQN